MKHLLKVLLLFSLLPACSVAQTADSDTNAELGIITQLNDGYQFGDITRGLAHDLSLLVALRDKTCKFIGADDTRKALDKVVVMLIRGYMPAYPANGICTSEFDQAIAAIRAAKGVLEQ